LDTIFESTVLERLRVSERRMLGSTTLGTLKLTREKALEETADEMYLMLEATVLATRLCADTVRSEVSYPATWWQHLKHDLPWRLGAWVRKRWPVRTARADIAVDFKIYDTYPRADVQLPELGTPVWLEYYNWHDVRAEPPGTIKRTYDSGVSRGREYVPVSELLPFLRSEVEGALLRDNYSYFLSEVNGEQKHPHPYVVIDEVLKILGACQVNTSELVRRATLTRRS
jgi:hypothetical protein